MIRDEIRRELKRIDAPAVPSNLVAQARLPTGRVQGLQERSRWAGLGPLIAAVLIAGSFTAPGRAATDWVSDLAGFGDEPSLPQAGTDDRSAVVVESGRLSDGTPYEVVAKRFNTSNTALHNAGVCFAVDWTTAEDRGEGGACTAADAEHRNREPLEASGIFTPPRASSKSPALFLGLLENERVAGASLLRYDNGQESEIESAVILLDGEALDRVGPADPIRVHVAQIESGDLIAARSGESRISEVGYSDQGEEIAKLDLIGPGVPRPVEPSEAGIKFEDLPEARVISPRCAERLQRRFDELRKSLPDPDPVSGC